MHLELLSYQSLFYQLLGLNLGSGKSLYELRLEHLSPHILVIRFDNSDGEDWHITFH